MSKQPASAFGYKTAIKVINNIRFLHSIMLVALAVKLISFEKAYA